MRMRKSGVPSIAPLPRGLDIPGPWTAPLADASRPTVCALPLARAQTNSHPAVCCGIPLNRRLDMTNPFKRATWTDRMPGGRS